MNPKTTGMIVIITLSSIVYIIHRKYKTKNKVKKYTEYMNLNVKELKALCLKNNIPNINKMRKHEMIDVLIDLSL